jgi:putative oxidoreductase
MAILPEHIAPLLVRLMLGLLFFAQGYDKVFHIGVSRVIETIRPSYRKLRLPSPLITLSAYFTSYVELAGGLLLITGLFKYFSLYLLGLDLIVVAFGFCILNPVWHMSQVFYRLALLVFLLVYPNELDTLTLSRLFD